MTPDPFSLLGLEPRFDLDRGALERAYLERSALTHPDAGGGDPALNAPAAALNEAKRTLDDPERRAEALLTLLGGPSREADRTLPPGFLPEIMEVREGAEGARAEGDRCAGLARWRAWAEGRRGEHIAAAARLFRELPPAPFAESLRAIRVELNAWRYIERMAEQLDPDYDPGRELGAGALRSTDMAERKSKTPHFLLAVLIAVFVGWWFLSMNRGAPVPPAFDESVTLAAAIERSAASGKPVLALATADWCGPCQSFKGGALADERVARAIRERFEPVYVDVDKREEEARRLNVGAIPATILLRDGREVARLQGGIPADEMLAWLDRGDAPGVPLSPPVTPGG